MTELLAFVLGGCVFSLLTFWLVTSTDAVKAKMAKVESLHDEVIHLRGKVAGQENALKQHEELQDMVFEMIGLQVRKIEQEMAALKKEKEDAA